jgi:hypothetical protein
MAEGIRKVKTSDLELKDRLVSIQRVTKVTKGGRTFSFSAIVVVGNEDGIVGHGLGKASEVTTAIAKGIEDAKKNLIRVPVINGTIPHEQIYQIRRCKGLYQAGFSWYRCQGRRCYARSARECGSQECPCKIKRFFQSSQSC